jgi:ATP-dependent Clp protease ATP-binding subunit ClpA
MLNRIREARRSTRRTSGRENALSVIRRSEIEAKRVAAKVIEAEHILLALAAHPDDDAGMLLNEFGLDHGRLASALHDEHVHSLAFAGVEPLDQNQAEATHLDCSLALGTSAKMAIKRAMFASRGHRRRLDSTDLLAGILEAELGTVPRALAIAGIDRTALISRIRGR